MAIKDEIIPAVAQKTAFSGALLSVFGAFSSEIIFGLLGVLIALLGVLVNRYYTRKRFHMDQKQREQDQAFAAEKHRAFMERQALKKEYELELHKARISFLNRTGYKVEKRDDNNLTIPEMLEARALGIDVGDWSDSVLGEDDGDSTAE